MREIREIYEKWLDGSLAQEDALFAIGDILGVTDTVGGAEQTILHSQDDAGRRPARARMS